MEKINLFDITMNAKTICTVRCNKKGFAKETIKMINNPSQREIIREVENISKGENDFLKVQVVFKKTTTLDYGYITLDKTQCRALLA